MMVLILLLIAVTTKAGASLESINIRKCWSLYESLVFFLLLVRWFVSEFEESHVFA